ncbi:hypothetical protein K470DRAFT_264448 [Piedraia hortae CBS 480.64]|uniref:Uncharacterized protein n=1 Tax=Piedraia hortae CBS 480.64 TaxID=1314780 RepID=A0A6A7C186_9PEZI|nr:hypothetical protein K470DRAFT_264448 [Piedraia hortae CBS 480.64]
MHETSYALATNYHAMGTGNDNNSDERARTSAANDEPAATSFLKQGYCESIVLPIKDSQVDKECRAGLAQAYANDYGLNLGAGTLHTGRSIKWFKQFSFADPSTQQRVTLDRLEFVLFHDNSIGNVDCIFSNKTADGNRRISLRMFLTSSHPSVLNKVLTGLPLRRFTDERAITTGAPAVKSQRLYLLSV